MKEGENTARLLVSDFCRSVELVRDGSLSVSLLSLGLRPEVACKCHFAKIAFRHGILAATQETLDPASCTPPTSFE